MRSFIDLSEKVQNKEFRTGQVLEYYPATIVTGARRQPALFTAAQISTAMARASGNPEDIPQPRKTLWQRLKAWMLG